ncbi:MAG: hypothetical protein H6625_08320 [Bdellovibrionaceae bacterium]|nr:hypothetical protein [Pseudobdellovibrionaceae bacterium]
MSQFKCSRRIMAPKSQVFEYMLSPQSWPDLLRQHIQVEMQVVPQELRSGNIYKMTMSRFGLAQPVELKILNYIKNTSVTYKQTHGLFSKWIHTQNFEDVEGSETLVTDIVEYQLPLGLIGHLLDDLLVRQDMKNILEDRLNLVASHFS